VVVADIMVAEEKVEDESEKRCGGLRIYYTTCVSLLYCVGSYSVVYESLVQSEASKDAASFPRSVADFACKATGGQLGESREPALSDILSGKSAFVYDSPVSYRRNFDSKKSITICSSNGEELQTGTTTIGTKLRDLHIRTAPAMPLCEW
jgi:hypothetical protein